MGIEDYDILVGYALWTGREGESERETVDRVWRRIGLPEWPEDVGRFSPADLRAARRRLSALRAAPVVRMLVAWGRKREER